MGLFAVLSRVEDAFFARALVATQQTVDDVSGLLDSVCSLAVASCSLPLSSVPSSSFSASHAYAQAAAQDDFPPQVQEALCEALPKMPGPEQTQDISDSLISASVAVKEETTLSFLNREQGAEEKAVHLQIGKSLQESTFGSPFKAQFLVQDSERRTLIQDLDVHCLTCVMRFLNNRSLQACSLVSHEWLEASNFARSSLRVGTSVLNLPVLLKRFGRLQRLRLVHRPLPFWGTEHVAPSAAFNDMTMHLIAQQCPLLQELALAGCWAFTDEGLAAVLMACSDLGALHFAHCDGFTGEPFSQYFSQKFERVVFTYCDGLTNRGVEAIAGACPGLRELSITRQHENPSFLRAIRKVALRCSNLEKVAIGCCGVTDDSLLIFAFSCKKIHTFCIGGESNISGYGIDLLRSYLPCLKNLGLKNNPKVELLSGNRANTPLKRLSLIWYNGADKHLERLLGEGTVEEVILEGCFRLSDVTIDRIFTQCRGLRRLVISESEGVTPQVFEAYVRSQSLAELEIRNCKLRSKQTMPEGLQPLRRLRVSEEWYFELKYLYRF